MKKIIIAIFVLLGVVLMSVPATVIGESELPDLRVYDIQRLYGKTFKAKFTNDGPYDMTSDFEYRWYVDDVERIYGTWTTGVDVDELCDRTDALNDYLDQGWNDIKFSVNYGQGRIAEVTYTNNYHEESFYIVI